MITTALASSILVFVCATDVLTKKDDTGGCGPSSLAVCLTSLQQDVLDSDVSSMITTDQGVSSLLQLKQAAEQLGFQVTAIKWRAAPRDFEFGSTPAIVQVQAVGNRKHFVALLECRDGEMCVVDYPRRMHWISAAVFREQFRWNGVALHIAMDRSALDRLRPTSDSVWWPGVLAAGLTGSLVIFVGFRRRAGTPKL